MKWIASAFRKSMACTTCRGPSVGSFAIVPARWMAAADSSASPSKGKGGHAAMPQPEVDTVLGQRTTSSPPLQGHRLAQAIRLKSGRNLRRSMAGFQRLTTSSRKPPSPAAARHLPQLEPEVRDMCERRIKEVVDGVCAPMGKGEVDYQPRLSVTVNDPEQDASSSPISQPRSSVRTRVATDIAPLMGVRGFLSYMLNARPGAYILSRNRRQRRLPSSGLCLRLTRPLAYGVSALGKAGRCAPMAGCSPDVRSHRAPAKHPLGPWRLSEYRGQVRFSGGLQW